MKIIIIFLIIIGAVGFLALTGVCEGMGKKKDISGEAAKIIFYKQGKKTVLDPQSPHFKKLQQKCEEFLSSATNVMRDFITEKKVLPIKKKELAVEVIYRKPKEIKISFFNRILKANHLLIPLTGDYVCSGENTPAAIFFYGPRYGPDYMGPHWTQRDIKEIKQLLVLMNINVNQEEGKRR